MSAEYGYRKPEDLPRVIPLFPVDGALMLPRAPLPLHVFEPRYLNMVDDALSSDRIIGMVQKRPGADGETPALETVGSAGRITAFSETADGRYMITLMGVCRFVIAEEIERAAPYRRARVDFTRFAADLSGSEHELDLDRDAFKSALQAYLDANGLRAEWDAIEDAQPAQLVNSLSMICPFSHAEKQALLEAVTLADRRDALLTLLRMGAAGSAGPEGGVQ